MLEMEKKGKLVWTDEDTKVVRAYKDEVRSGKISPIRYTGNLKDILES